MPELLRMPEVSADAESATLSAWPTAELQKYVAGDVIVVIETAKAMVDVEAEDDGVIVKQLVAPGTDVQVGAPIALTARPDEVIHDADRVLADLGVTTAAPHGGGPATQARARQADTASPAAPAVCEPAAAGRTFSSPLARRLAREAGLELDAITGSGPGGRILRRDVENSLARRPVRDRDAAVPADAAAPATPARAEDAVVHSGATVDVPHSRMRRLIAQRLSESKQTVPHFYLRGTARAGRLLELRAELNADGATKVSINDLVVKAVASAHRLVPEVNVVWGPDAVTRFAEVDLSIAIATPNGLVTPVLRAVDRMSITQVAAASREFIQRANAGQLQQAELVGGSATITNLGMYGTEEFAAIINPPQSTILAVGAVAPAAVVTDERGLQVCDVLRVTLSVDHRPIDGATAAAWMRKFLQILENPIRILA
jgi:pyruvate dehydrogenase E2 component (dihydrolipoamide acetyltransferase)